MPNKVHTTKHILYYVDRYYYTALLYLYLWQCRKRKVPGDIQDTNKDCFQTDSEARNDRTQ